MSEKSKSKKVELTVNDFDLFCKVVKSTSKIIDSAKFSISQNGLQIYGARNKTARCEIESNSVTSPVDIEFSILDLNMLVKVLSTISSIHSKDYSGFKFIVDSPFVRFESKKFKTKLITCTEDVISKWISKKVEAKLTPVFEFNTTSEIIQQVNSHAFLFSDQSSVKIYIEMKDDMEKNAVYATLGNRETSLNNEITLKLGLATLGSLNGKNVIVDLERLNLFNACPSNEIKISLMNMNVLVSSVKAVGKNDSYFSLKLYNSILKA